ncbi:MAG: DNA repair exonuclease [Spirochaetes bacterium]|nr:DNA repair exonuclease [Spirochaetota bacterium]
MHFSDTHLGYSDLDTVSDRGINQRELDFYAAFEQVISQCLEIKPQAVIHSGDLFHRSSPANRPMIECLTQLKRLSAKNIPFYVIAGNHSTPKTIYTSPILKALSSIDGIYPIFSQKYEYFVQDDLAIHGIPHINDDRHLVEELEKLKPLADKMNIVLLHTSIGKKFLMEEYGEKLFPEEKMDLLKDFHYIALGHWHQSQQVKKLPNAWYSGSIERQNEKEAEKAKGFLLVEFSEKKKTKVTFCPLSIRNWHVFEIKDCHLKDDDQLQNELKKLSQKEDFSESLITLHFKQLKPTQALTFSNQVINQHFAKCLNLSIRRHFIQETSTQLNFNTNTESLENLFCQYLQEQIEEQKDQKELIGLARQYFHQYEEQKTNL